MLTRLKLNHFKAWRELDITFGQITGLFGTNSSGKSSLIQWLLLLKQTKNATDMGLVLDLGAHGQYVNLGSFKDIIHRHDTDTPLEWQLAWSFDDYDLRITDSSDKRNTPLFAADSIQIRGVIQQDAKRLTATELEYRFAEHNIRLKPKMAGETEYALDIDGPEGSEFRFLRTKGRPWALPGPVKNYRFPDQARTYHQNADFLSDFEAEYEAMIDRIFYLGPLRDHPRRDYHWSGASPTDVGLRGERTMDAILAATAANEQRNLGKRTHYKPFQEIIAHWLRKLGLIHEFRVEEIGEESNLYRAHVRQQAKGPEALLTDVGFGVSQVLPVLVLLYYVPEGSTLLLEQPEIHLHPSVQSGLADAILSAATTRNLQVIVESHSEHLLKRLQRRVAEGKHPASTVNLYFCSQHKGEAHLDNLRLNNYGEIENWPENFFGDDFSEIAAIQKASLKRRMEAEQE